jgi:hypothetical protein
LAQSEGVGVMRETKEWKKAAKAAAKKTKAQLAKEILAELRK